MLGIGLIVFVASILGWHLGSFREHNAFLEFTRFMMKFILISLAVVLGTGKSYITESPEHFVLAMVILLGIALIAYIRNGRVRTLTRF